MPPSLPLWLLLLLGAPHRCSAPPSAGGAAVQRPERKLTVPVEVYGRDGRAPQSVDARFFGMVYAPITLGTPPRRFNVQLDTGSSTLILPAPDCAGCGAYAATTHFAAKHSGSASLVPCASEQCGGYCKPTVCRASDGAVCDPRRAPPPRLVNRSQARGCQDDPAWPGADGRGCAKYTAEPDWCGEGESLSRCPASCGACGRCCVPGDGCFFEQRYADETRATGNPLFRPFPLTPFATCCTQRRNAAGTTQVLCTRTISLSGSGITTTAAPCGRHERA